MMILTLELEKQADVELAEVALCCDEEGLEYLIQLLKGLQGKRTHYNLKTPAWAGQELTETSQGGPNYVLLNHLRIVKL